MAANVLIAKGRDGLMVEILDLWDSNMHACFCKDYFNIPHRHLKKPNKYIESMFEDSGWPVIVVDWKSVSKELCKK